jgi:phage shock protein C
VTGGKPVLRKSRDRAIAGVCAGIAEFLGWQPVQIRAIFIACTVIWGAGLWVYLILWIAMPPADPGPRARA